VLETAYIALTASTRALIDAQLRTRIDSGEALEIAQEIDVLVKRLLESAGSEPLGVSFPHPGRPLRNDHGNAVVGVRNAIAPPLVTVWEREGCWAEFALGASYEGPPGHVHGGVCALILDQVMGEGAAAAGYPGMTAGLTIRFHRPTPLGRLRAEAELHEREGRKAYVNGRILGPDGQVTVSAQGVYVMPKRLQEAHHARQDHG
jgi:acyl-coenzyme A thioesterase PaaI-like protein